MINIGAKETKREEKKSPFQINKETFLQENYDSKTTQDIYFDIWKYLIKKTEEIKNKDLYNFTKDEIEGLIMALPTSSTSRKGNLLSFIKNYCEWCVYKGLINVNPTATIDNDKILKVNRKVLKKQMYSFNCVYNTCKELNGVASIFSWLPLILARFGITGKDFEWITNLRWSDIDFENKVVHIIDKNTGEYIKEVEVDDRFLEIIKQAKDTTVEKVAIKDRKTKSIKFIDIEYIDYGYVIKKRSDSKVSGEQTDENEIYRNLKNMFNVSGIESISLGKLVKSRKIELLLEKRRERKLTNNDVFAVGEMLNPSASRGSYVSLRREYESLTKDEVFSGRTPLEQLVDENANEFVDEMMMELFEE